MPPCWLAAMPGACPGAAPPLEGPLRPCRPSTELSRGAPEAWGYWCTPYWCTGKTGTAVAGGDCISGWWNLQVWPKAHLHAGGGGRVVVIVDVVAERARALGLEPTRCS